MQQRSFSALLAIGAMTGAVMMSGCGSNPTAKASTPAAPVRAERDTEAVAALDGSAVFTIRADLVRIDPDTNAAVASWPLPQGMESIRAVAPNGRWVALTDRKPGYGDIRVHASTKLVVFDPTTGTETHHLTLDGDLQPEAFSVDGLFLFALDYRGDHYRVQTITLATGERYDTDSRDKTEREDMHGTSVRAVLNRDHTLLSTLYRNPTNADEPAFVHILDLVHGWAYCADLPRPFGTGPQGSDLIELTPSGTILVTAKQAGRVAEIHIAEVHKPDSKPVTVEYRALPTEPA